MYWKLVSNVMALGDSYFFSVSFSLSLSQALYVMWNDLGALIFLPPPLSAYIIGIGH